MPVFEKADFDNHEQVIFVTDKSVGLQGIIAIHSTALGPAAGGCRMHPYTSADDALTDVLRLSKGMSYKNAMADLPLGGGKCVIIADPDNANKAELLRAFSKHIQLLGGRYWTAIDVGVGPADADLMAEQCDYIFARASQYEAGFNPSSFTALGGFTGISAAVSHVYKKSLSGLTVAVQGLGATGADLSSRLHEAGANLVVTDVREEAVREIVERFNAKAVAPEAIHQQDVDVFAPCAMGAILNDKTIPEIKAKVVCGLANNQLAEAHNGQQLNDMGICYVPDYVVNAGGVMGAATVIYSEPDREASIEKIHGLHNTITDILQISEKSGKPTAAVADDMARARISGVTGH